MKYKLLGAIVGDIYGKPYEYKERPDTLEFDLNEQQGTYTDDTVCTVAIADAILNNPKDPDFKGSLVKWCRKYRDVGYGAKFIDWFEGKEQPVLDSYGNGAAMRTSACAFFHDFYVIRKYVEGQVKTSHDHPSSYNAAETVSYAICDFWEHNAQYNIEELKDEVLIYFGFSYPDYDFSKPIEEVRKDYKFDCTCDGSVPQALRCFYESTSYEDCIRRCIWLGGDTDTTAAIAGSIAYACYKEIPDKMIEYALSVLPEEMIDVIIRFDKFTE